MINNTQYNKYIKLLKKKKEVICGFKENEFGEAIVTTGIPKQYKQDETTYINQRQETYDNYISRQIRK